MVIVHHPSSEIVFFVAPLIFRVRRLLRLNQVELCLPSSCRLGHVQQGDVTLTFPKRGFFHSRRGPACESPLQAGSNLGSRSEDGRPDGRLLCATISTYPVMANLSHERVTRERGILVRNTRSKDAKLCFARLWLRFCHESRVKHPGATWTAEVR